MEDNTWKPRLTIKTGQRKETRVDEFNNIMSRMLDHDPVISQKGFADFDKLSREMAPRGHLTRVK